MRNRPTKAYVASLPVREGCIAQRVKVWDLPISFEAYQGLYAGVPQDVAGRIEEAASEGFGVGLQTATTLLAVSHHLPHVKVYAAGRSGGWVYLDGMKPDRVVNDAALRRFVTAWVRLVRLHLKHVVLDVQERVKEYKRAACLPGAG